MAVTEGIALFVAHGFEELVNPNGSINGQALAVQGGEVGGPRAGLDDLPEALNTHLGGCSRVGSERPIGLRIPTQGWVESSLTRG